MPVASFAQAFGKVFSTPLERQYLDRQRREMFAELTEAERMQALQEPVRIIPEMEAPPTIIHMGGTVRRADGFHTIWVNGVPVDEKSLPTNARLEFQRGVGVLIVNTSDGTFTIRPGQTLNADSGEIREDYELTPAQLESVQRELARREALSRPVVTTAEPRSQTSDTNVEEQSDENQAMVQEVLEALRMLQQARDIQEALP